MNIEKHPGRKQGAVGARPLLFIILAVISFAAASLVTKALMSPVEIEAKLRADLVEIDREAVNLSALIIPAPLDPDRLRDALLAVPAQESADIEHPREAPAWRDQVTVEQAEDDGLFIVRLRTDTPSKASRDIDGLIEAFVRRQNQRRTEQKEEAASWFDRTSAALRAKIDEAKEAIVQSPYNPDPIQGRSQTESEQLLQLMIGATAEAKAQSTAPANGDGPERADQSVERVGGLGADVTHLTGVLSDIEEGRAAQLRHGKTLKDAEVALAELRKSSGTILGEGSLLDRPAATLVMPAKPVDNGSFQLLETLGPLGWQIMLPVLAALSLILALFGVLLVHRLRPPPAEVASDDYLKDPNWPLPRGSQRDLSF